ncbi:RHS repeat-associated core domain-containing protein [Pseudomonas putida]|uniref:RHS repeat-associated core domain-containing protein n=1 Tax=Pseudomonas putida TaxID=303 RepID=UPI0039AEDD35
MPFEAVSLPPYGYLPPQDIRTLIIFNGQWRDPLSQMDILGNGYRPFNTAIRRFCAPDVLQSPFGDGGANSYAYCENDPINKTDSSGQASMWLISGLKGLGNALGFRTPSRNRPNMPNRPARTANNDYSSGPVRRPNEGRPLPEPPVGGRIAESRSNNQSGIGYSSPNDADQASYLNSKLNDIESNLLALGGERSRLKAAISRQTRIGNKPAGEKRLLSQVDREIHSKTNEYNQMNDRITRLRSGQI